MSTMNLKKEFRVYLLALVLLGINLINMNIAKNLNSNQSKNLDTTNDEFKKSILELKNEFANTTYSDHYYMTENNKFAKGKKNNTLKAFSVLDDFNSADYVKFARFSGAAYCSEANLKNWGCINCNEDTEGTIVTKYLSNKQYETAGYIAVNKNLKNIIIAYRGSINMVNWVNNFNVFKVDVNVKNSAYTGAKLHIGFYQMADSLFRSTADEVSRLFKSHPSYKVVFLGHSLGGAIATISAFNLVEKGILDYNNIELYTFGQPRAGNEKFASYLYQTDMKIFRITNSKDLVPLMPPSLFGYLHFHREYYIQENLEVVVCDDLMSWEDSNCLLRDSFSTSPDAHFNYWGYKMITNC